MSRFRKIDPRIWGDQKFMGLSPLAPSGQALWLYFLTNPFIDVVPGLFAAGEAMLAEALGWPLERFRELFAELSGKGMAKADWKARLVWLPNAIRYNFPPNCNVVLGWGRALHELPECPLKTEAVQALRAALAQNRDLLKAFDKVAGNGMGNGIGNGTTNGMPNQEKEKETEKEQEQEGGGAASPRPASPAPPPPPPSAHASHQEGSKNGAAPQGPSATTDRPQGAHRPPAAAPAEQGVTAGADAKGEAATATGTAPPTPEEFVTAWNEAAGRAGMCTAKAITGDRLRAFRERAADPAWCRDWRQALARLEKSTFVGGDNPRRWKATADWFLGSLTVTKTLEGAYDKGPTPTKAFADKANEEMEKKRLDATKRRQVEEREKWAQENERLAREGGVQSLGSVLNGIQDRHTAAASRVV